MNKKETRNKILTIRNSITEKSLIEKSALIENCLIEIINEKNIERIYLYASYGSEVKTDNLIQYCIANDIRVALPKIIDGNACSMNFFQIDDIKDLKIGYKGILEPDLKQLDEGVFSPQMIVMPGVAFDRHGNRIGYGKGFYDRFLNGINTKDIILVAIAFDEQLVDNIDNDINDVKVDLIITESGCINIK